jgi:hypothetical protein
MSQYLNQENLGEFVPQREYKGMNPSKRFKDDSDFIRIYDLMEPVLQTNRDIYLVSEKVFEVFYSVFEEYEEKCLIVSHHVLFEIVYKIVERTIIELQQGNYTSIEEIMKLNLNTLSLFMEPINATDVELKFAEKFMEKESDEYEVEIKLPENAQRNYIINFKRILDKNNSNPDFNETILNFFDRNRDIQ